MARMKHYVIANWKMYLSAQKSVATFKQLLRWEKTHKWNKNLEVVVAPPLIALPEIAALLRKARSSQIRLCAQDIGFAEEGAFTGGIAPRDVKRLGVQYALVGHSERRQYFSEDTGLCRRKAVAARAGGLKVVYCVGETKDERHAGRVHDVVREQLAGVKADVVAYEPRWAIGTGIPIAPGEAETVHAFIAHEAAGKPAVCYGGSVSPENVMQFVALEDTAGVLVGSASTTLKSLCSIISKVDKRS